MAYRPGPQDWHHMLALGIVTAIVSGGLAYFFLRVDLIPDTGSMERGLIDGFAQDLFAIGSIFFCVIISAFVYSLIFFRPQPGDESDAPAITGNATLELLWTIVPLIIVVVVSVYGAAVLNQMTAENPAAAPEATGGSGALQKELVVNVTAVRFVWQFEYPDYGIKSYALEVPVNRRILFNIRSGDVVHSFWVQEWGPKQDAVPGMTTQLRITPTKTGDFLVQCSQLCGFGHSNMTAPVHVVASDDFDKWIQEQKTSSSPATPPTGQQVMIDLVAQNIAFDKKTITVPPGAEVMIHFDNKDNGVPHNFAVYTNSTAQDKIFSGPIITGPKTTTYTFTAPKTPGNYFFRCDVHPTTMTGTLVVQ